MNLFRKYQVHIILTTLAALVITLAFNFGALVGVHGGATDTLIEVNGDAVTLGEFNTYYNRALSQVQPGQALTKEMRDQKKGEVLRDLVMGVLMAQQAKKFGIQVPDQQVVSTLANVPGFQESGAFSPAVYQRALQYQLRSTAREFEEEQRRQIAIFKLTWLIRSSIKLTDKEFSAAEKAQGSDLAKGFAKGDGKHVPTFAEIQSRVRNEIWQENVQWDMDEWLSRVRNGSNIKLHRELLQEVP